MSRSRLDKRRFRSIADGLSLPQSEVERAVGSFFGNILSYARALPYNTSKKIFYKEAFGDFVKVFNIPFIGRIGPVYSRYLRWRANESKLVMPIPKSEFLSRFTPEEIDKLAKAFLSNDNPIEVPKKKKNSELYNRIWMVGKEGKKSARQVIPKNNTYVQD